MFEHLISVRWVPVHSETRRTPRAWRIWSAWRDGVQRPPPEGRLRRARRPPAASFPPKHPHGPGRPAPAWGCYRFPYCRVRPTHPDARGAGAGAGAADRRDAPKCPYGGEGGPGGAEVSPEKAAVAQRKAEKAQKKAQKAAQPKRPRGRPKGVSKSEGPAAEERREARRAVRAGVQKYMQKYMQKYREQKKAEDPAAWRTSLDDRAKQKRDQERKQAAEDPAAWRDILDKRAKNRALRREKAKNMGRTA